MGGDREDRPTLGRPAAYALAVFSAVSGRAKPPRPLLRSEFTPVQRLDDSAHNPKRRAADQPRSLPCPTVRYWTERVTAHPIR